MVLLVRKDKREKLVQVDLLVRKDKREKLVTLVLQVMMEVMDQKVKKVKLDLKFRFSTLLLQMVPLHIVLLVMVL